MALYGRMTHGPSKEALLLEIAALRTRLDEVERQAFALDSRDEGEEAKFMQAMETLFDPGSQSEE